MINKEKWCEHGHQITSSNSDLYSATMQKADISDAKKLCIKELLYSAEATTCCLLIGANLITIRYQYCKVLDNLYSTNSGKLCSGRYKRSSTTRCKINLLAAR